eukprot:symbB.v1.2.023887.t1/scaffold2222.1/size85392/3
MFRSWMVLLAACTTWPVAAVDDVCVLVQSQVTTKKLTPSTVAGELKRGKDDGSSNDKAQSQLTKLMRLKQELHQLTGELDGILGGQSTVSGTRGGGMRLGAPLQQNIIINNSKIFGNVINGNNAAPIHSDFVGNSIRDLRISAGDTAWKHEVIMPIGNTRKSVDVSANGTDINHHVNTDLFDQNSHSIGEAATSRSFGRLTEEVQDLEEEALGGVLTASKANKNFTSLRNVTSRGLP